MLGRIVLLAMLAGGCGRFAFDESKPPLLDGSRGRDGGAGDVIFPDGSIFDHLVGYWQFEDTTFSDSSTFGHAGTCVFGCPGIVPGLHGNAGDFNNAPGIEIGTVAPLSSLATTLTLTGWVNLRSLTDYGALISNDRDCSNCGVISGFSLWSSLYASVPRFLLWNQSMTTFGTAGAASLPLDTWVFLAATYDDQDAKLYIDGQVVDSVARQSAIGTPHSYPLRIGHQGFDYAGGVDGLIDDVMIFDAALTAAEITTLYDSQKP